MEVAAGTALVTCGAALCALASCEACGFTQWRRRRIFSSPRRERHAALPATPPDDSSDESESMSTVAEPLDQRPVHVRPHDERASERASDVKLVIFLLVGGVSHRKVCRLPSSLRRLADLHAELDALLAAELRGAACSRLEMQYLAPRTGEPVLVRAAADEAALTLAVLRAGAVLLSDRPVAALAARQWRRPAGRKALPPPPLEAFVDEALAEGRAEREASAEAEEAEAEAEAEADEADVELSLDEQIAAAVKGRR